MISILAWDGPGITNVASYGRTSSGIARESLEQGQRGQCGR